MSTQVRGDHQQLPEIGFDRLPVPRAEEAFTFVHRQEAAVNVAPTACCLTPVVKKVNPSVGDILFGNRLAKWERA